MSDNEFKDTVYGSFGMRMEEEVAGQTCVLTVQLYKEFPRLLSRDSNGGKIFAKMDPITFFAFLDALEDVARGEINTWECENHNEDTKNGGGRYLESKTVIERENDRICIYLVDCRGDTPSVKYYFKPTKYHMMRLINGAEIDAAKASKDSALAWVKCHRYAYGASAQAQLDHHQARKSGGQGGNNYQNNNQQGGNQGYQKKQWNGGNNQQGNGGYQKKQWNGNGGNQGGYQKKQWNNNGGGGNNNWKNKGNWNKGNGGGGGNYQNNNNYGGGNNGGGDSY